MQELLAQFWKWTFECSSSKTHGAPSKEEVSQQDLVRKVRPHEQVLPLLLASQLAIQLPPPLMHQAPPIG